GAMAQYHLNFIKIRPQTWSRIVPFAVLLPIAFAPDFNLPYSHVVLVYAAIPSTVLAIACLHSRPSHPKWKLIDDWLADLSYPIFLLHWPVAAAVATILHADVGALLLMTTFPVTVGFSHLVIRFIEAPVKSLRQTVRQQAAKSASVVHLVHSADAGAP